MLIFIYFCHLCSLSIMPYFLVENNIQPGLTVEVSGSEARHILLAQRVKVGEIIKVQGPDGKRFECEVSEVKKDRLKIVAKKEVGVPPEPDKQVVLFQAVVAEQALDTILQKSTELRAAKIVLFNSERVGTKLSSDRWQSKKDRWNKILWEAAKQSERAKPPELEFVSNFKDAVTRASKVDQVILLDPDSSSNLKSSISNPSAHSAVAQGRPEGTRGAAGSGQVLKSIGLVVGPEGGLTEQENQEFKSLPNCLPVNLGPILLRADTAVIASLAIVQNLI